MAERSAGSVARTPWATHWLILAGKNTGAKKMTERRPQWGGSPGRLILMALILVLGAYWIGARYGPVQVSEVEARHIAATPARGLSPAGTPERAANLTE